MTTTNDYPSTWRYHPAARMYMAAELDDALRKELVDAFGDREGTKPWDIQDSHLYRSVAERATRGWIDCREGIRDIWKQADDMGVRIPYSEVKEWLREAWKAIMSRALPQDVLVVLAKNGYVNFDRLIELGLLTSDQADAMIRTEVEACVECGLMTRGQADAMLGRLDRGAIGKIRC